MKSLNIITVALASVSLLGGCIMDAEIYDADGIGVVSLPAEVPNDSAINGGKINGGKINGGKINGGKINGSDLTGVTLSGTTFSGTDNVTSQPLTGTDFIGVDFPVTLADGSDSTVRISNIEASSTPDLNLYTVEYYDNGSWENICEGDAKAIPTRGIWNHDTGDFSDDGTQFTFACMGAAIAKCLRWGYLAWDTSEECNGQSNCKDQSLHNFHLACIRMVRADYCGDGTAHTEDGTLIDAYDALSIMSDDTGLIMDFEAEWTADGGHCIKHTRWENSTTDLNAYDYIQANCPSRWVGPSDTTCGSASSTFHTSNGFDTDLATRSLFFNESDNNYRY